MNFARAGLQKTNTVRILYCIAYGSSVWSIGKLTILVQNLAANFQVRAKFRYYPKSR